MAEYNGPSTDNEAHVISTSTGGHRVPDRYATGDDNMMKLGYGHESIIDNSLARYTEDTPEGWC